MRPVLARGDYVVLQKTSNYSLGDIVVFRRGGNVFIHRVVRLQPEGLSTKGDANLFDDGGVVKVSDVFGRMVFQIPLLGHVSLALSGK